MGAITDWRVSGDKARLGAAALAAAVAILGAQLLDAGGITDLTKSIYLVPRLNWIGAIGGGLLFGYGMVLAGGCPSRVLVRAGGGDLRALIALMALAVAALAALSGVLGSARVGIEQATAIDLGGAGLHTQSATDALGTIGFHGGIARLIGIVLVGGPAPCLCPRTRAHSLVAAQSGRRSRRRPAGQSWLGTIGAQLR